MEQMLSETLTYLRDDARTESTLFVDLPSVLQTISTEWTDLGKAVTYDGPGRLTYRCKLSAITRAINNLVDNAVKFGTQVWITLEELPDGQVQIDVVDDGPGISEANRDRAFEPFFKADTARGTKGKEGFGLGLSIARRVIEDHSGKIELLESVPHGLRVRIRLPPVRLCLQSDAQNEKGNNGIRTFVSSAH
jgi:signal transduction histidine kinase